MNHNSSFKTSNRFPVRRLTTLALLTAAALMIYGLESLIPPLVPVPGIKLGLANVVTLLALKRYGVRDAFLVLLARILLSAFFFGSLMSMLYSLCGGMLCLLAIWLVDLLLLRHFLFSQAPPEQLHIILHSFSSHISSLRRWESMHIFPS